MDSYSDVKLKITSIVTKWELANYHLFLRFLDARKKKTDTLRTKFGETDQKMGYIERLLFEMPEELDAELVRELNDFETKFFRSKEGGIWFAKTFKQYVTPEKI